MKTITLEQFIALTNNTAAWNFSFDTTGDRNFLDRDVINQESGEWEGETETYVRVTGAATRFATLNDDVLGTIEVTYSESFSYDEFEEDTFACDTDGMDDVWTVNGVIVVDEDGDELNAHNLGDYIENAAFKGVANDL